MKLAGIGTAVPTHAIQQEDAARRAIELGTTWKHQRTLRALYLRSGVQQRHTVVMESPGAGLPPEQTFYTASSGPADRGPTTAQRMQKYEQAAGELAESASRAAICSARILPSAVTHIVTVCCSGFAAPGVDVTLIDRLNLSRDVERVHVGFMGCHGALNGLRVARGLVAATPGACVLLCAVELCSLHHQYTDDPEQLVANALFADGAAAVIVQEDSTGVPAWQLVSQASTVVPNTAEMMSWKIGDHGFAMSLSPQVPEVIRRELKPWLSKWLRQSALEIDQVRSWAIHPGGPRILSAAADALGLAPVQLTESRQILATHGNMSSPTVLFILQRVMATADSSPCVLLAFGPGLTIEAGLVRNQDAAPQ